MKKQLFLSAFAAFFFLGDAIAQNGASLNFDGANDNVNLGSAITSSLAGGTKVSVEAWVKPSSLSGLGCIVGNYNTGASALQILLRRSGNSYYEFWVGNGGNWYVTNSVATPTLNAWQHVAATWDGTVSCIYVNGVLSGTTTPVISTLGNASNAPVWIGYNTINENFTGNIDEVRIWNIARTQSQIQSSMDCQASPATPGLLASYNFNEGTSGGNNAGITSVNDGSGNGNTATLNGFSLSGGTSNFTNDIRTDYFSLQSAIGSVSMADRMGNGYAIDYNNDGWNDVLVGAENSEIRLYLNNGKGNFSNYTVAHAAGSGTLRAMGDMDNDGDLDYVITKPGTVTVYINNGNGTFTTYPTNVMNGTGDMTAVKIGDINGDGKADLILGNNNTGTTDKNEIWLNSGTTGSPSFTFSADFINPLSQTAIATGDVDEDGDVDILYGSSSNSGTLYLNNSNNGTFSLGTAPVGYSGGAELIDWNKDGHLDFINYEMYNRSLLVRYGYGNGTFSAVTILLTNSVINMGRLIDINGDGFLDFVASNWGGNGLVYINNGCSFTLQNSCNYNLGSADNTVTLADFNNDGTPDVFCQARDNKSSFYLNFLTAVTTPSLSNIVSAPSVTACSGASAVLTATADASGTLQWFNSATGGSSISTSTNYTVNVSTGTYTYYVGAINANGCSSAIRKSVLLTVNPSPTISVNSGVICAGESFTMMPSGADTYTYSNGSDVATPTTAASYTVTGTNALTGCENTAVSTVTVNTLPVIVSESGSVTVCGDATGTFSLVTTNTDTYAWVYSYNSGSQTVIDGSYGETGYTTAVMQIPSLESEGWDGYDITAILTSAEGCTLASTPKLITVNSQPTVSVNSGIVCAGTSFTMVPTGALTYSYSNGSDVVTATSSDTYTVTGTDANGCINAAISSVTVNMLPSVSAVSNNTLLCTGETATLSVSGASSYTWSTTENTTDITVSPTVQSTYTVMGTDANGCVGTTMITQNTDLCTGVAQIEAVVNEFTIYPNPSNGIFNIHVSTGYNITVLDVLGKVIYSEQLQSGTYTINLNQYANGLYILKAESNGASKTIRLVKH